MTTYRLEIEVEIEDDQWDPATANVAESEVSEALRNGGIQSKVISTEEWPPPIRPCRICGGRDC